MGNVRVETRGLEGGANENLEAMGGINGWIDIERLMIKSFKHPQTFLLL